MNWMMLLRQSLFRMTSKISKLSGQFWKMTSATFSRPTRSVDYYFSFAWQTNDTKKANLDRDIVYELIRGHGRTDMYLFYATVIGDFERVVEHWILEEEWIKT